MTGYATAAADLPQGSLQVELRSVNSRFLDLQFRIPEELRALEPVLRELVQARVSRGKVDCRVQWASQHAGERRVALDAAALAGLKRLSDEVRASFPDARALGVGDTIVAIGPDLAVPAGAERVAAEGATLLPGLFDAQRIQLMTAHFGEIESKARNK